MCSTGLGATSEGDSRKEENLNRESFPEVMTQEWNLVENLGANNGLSSNGRRREYDGDEREES